MKKLLSALHPSNLRLSVKGLILVLVPLIFGIVFIVSLFYSLERSRQHAQDAWRRTAALFALNRIDSLMIDAGQALLIYAAAREPEAGMRLTRIRQELPEQYNVLYLVCKDDPEKSKALKQLEELQKRALKIVLVSKEELDSGEHAEVLIQMSRTKGVLASLVSEFHKQQKELAESIAESGPQLPNAGLFRNDIFAQLQATVYSFLVYGVISACLLSLFLAAVFTKTISSRLAVTMDNAVKLANKEQLNPPLTGSDEMAALDKVFHKMATALEEAARKERATIEKAVDVICSIDSAMNFTAINPAALTVWGYLPEELLGTSLLEIIDQNDCDAIERTIRSRTDEIDTGSFEGRIKRKDGGIIHTLWSVHWSSLEETFFCVSHDITARKLAETLLIESEARIRQIMESMPVSLIVLNQSGQMELINPAAIAMFGYSPEEFSDAHFRKLFPELEKKGEDPFRELLSKAPGKVTQVNAVKNSGESFPVELSFSEFETREGRRRLAIILDVTERQEIERLKREFVAMVSHDLRTPLSALQGTIALFQRGAFGNVSERGQLSLGRADAEISRLIALINDLLDAEKLESGKFDIHLDRVSLQDVLNSSVDAVRRIAEQRQIDILTEPTDLKVTADGARLIQVIVNLLSNAIKFSPARSTVNIHALAFEREVEVRVSDQGRGVPESHKKLIFERFGQVEASDATKKGGTGLGLAICKAIIEQHGGTIGVDSEPGSGSTFWLRIPRYYMRSE